MHNILILVLPNRVAVFKKKNLQIKPQTSIFILIEQWFRNFYASCTPCFNSTGFCFTGSKFLNALFQACVFLHIWCYFAEEKLWRFRMLLLKLSVRWKTFLINSFSLAFYAGCKHRLVTNTPKNSYTQPSSLVGRKHVFATLGGPQFTIFI